jgi:AcrR family transcriptional regulator
MSISQRDASAAAASPLDAEGAAASRVAQRRAARRADNRADILDAAERVFAEYGIAGGSVRKIGADSGFSAAAIYTFFENKHQLLQETLTRRGEELLQGMRAVAERRPEPLDGLHQIIDVTIAFFEARRDFGQLLRHMRGGAQFAGPALSEFEGSDFALFLEAREIIAGLIRAGQAAGDIRPGEAHALAHLYEVLIYEFVSAGDRTGRLTQEELHGFIGGALNLPNS